MRQDQLDPTLGLRPHEPSLEGEGPHLVSVGVDQPGAAEVVEEGTPVVGEGCLLPELESVDRRVVPVSVALPVPEQEGHPHQVRVQVGGNLEGHGLARSQLSRVGFGLRASA